VVDRMLSEGQITLARAQDILKELQV
jgi:hypothetical protein